MASTLKKAFTPVADRPNMPAYGLLAAPNGVGLIPWRRARRKLETSHNYWVATASREGVPHCTPVWGIWLDNVFHFSSAPNSQKIRNFIANPRCIVATEDAAEPVIVEGVGEVITDRAMWRKIAPLYEAKYDWETSPNEGPWYAVRPRVIQSWMEFAMAGSATRWIFGPRANASR